MLLSTRIKVALALWFAGEAIVFVLIAHLIGFPEAMLLAFITSLFGWTLLKRAGASAMVKLRASLNGSVDASQSHRFLDDTLATVGAVALIVPGFLSDLVGLVLAVPVARDRCAVWIGRGGLAGLRPGRPRPDRGPSTIDLAPEDWERSEGPRRPIGKF